MNYKAIIFDLDGTAIPSKPDGIPSTKLIEIIAKYKQSIHLSVATGRSWFHAEKPIEQLGLISPCVISGGTQIINPINREIIWEIGIPNESILQLVEVAEKHNKKIAYVTGLNVTDAVISQKSLFNYNLPINTLYFLNVTNDELVFFQNIFAEIRDITASPTRFWYFDGVIDFHITNSIATKEFAIIELCKMLGVEKFETIGIGDGHNDIHLYNAVGYRVAMGNAEPELKLKADKVIGSIDEDGLACYLEEYFNK